MATREKTKEKSSGKGDKGGSGKPRRPLYASGEDIINKAKAEKKRRALDAEKRKAGNPFRFFVEKGDEKEIIILDAKVEAGLGVTEHRLKDAKGRWNRHEPCIGAEDSCPLCKAGNWSSYQIMLTVLDLTGYDNKRTGKHVSHSKRLLPITSNQLETFLDLQEANGGSLRGMYLVMKRDNVDKSYAIGQPKALKGGRSFKIFSEEQLVEDYGNKPKKDVKTGAIVKPRNDDITPFDYKKIFPEPDEEYIDALRDEFDEGNAPAGSRKQNAKSWDDDEEDEPEDDDEPKGRRSKPGSKTSGKKSRNDDDSDEDDSDDDEDSDDDDEEEEDSPKSKRASSRKSAPAARSKSRAARDDDDEDDEDDDSDSDEDEEEDDEEDERPAKKGRNSPRGRSSRDDEDDEDEEDSDDDDDDDSDSDEDEEEEERPAKKKSKPAPKSSAKRKVRSRDDDDEDDSDSDDDDDSDEDDSDDDEEEEAPAKSKKKSPPAKQAPGKKKPFSRR